MASPDPAPNIEHAAAYLIVKPKSCFIGGQWLAPATGVGAVLHNPATGEKIGETTLATAAEADQAVAAARQTFEWFSLSSHGERKAMLERLLAAFEAAASDLEELLIREVGVGRRVAEGQSVMCRAHIETALHLLESYEFTSTPADNVLVVKEPVGVCVAITSWNNPISQILCKAVPAIAAGCTVVVKPSELAPLIGIRVAEVFAEAALPAGIFNLVTGGGADVGARLVAHPEVDMISFTGSVPGGAAVARGAAPTIKRVHQELGGKSPNIVLPDADLEAVIPLSVAMCFMNSGQVCAAPTRLIVPEDRFADVAAIAIATVTKMVVGDPRDPATDMGPLANAAQYARVQRYIQSALDERLPLLVGGLGHPKGLEAGFFARPTIFGPVPRDATIAREEIFGPVLVIHCYRDEDEAIAIANDTTFGLAAYVESPDLDHAQRVARRIRAGHVTINFPRWNRHAPFGGYKQSGNGRQFGVWGFEEYLETKAIVTSG